jgi:hypothetical protein
MDWVPLFGSRRTRVIEQIFRVRPPACSGFHKTSNVRDKIISHDTPLSEKFLV